MDLIKRIWNLHTCWISFIRKRAKSFQNETSQFKIIIIQDFIKKNTCRCGKQQLPKTAVVIFIAPKNLNKNSFFYSYRAWKNKSGTFSQQNKNWNRDHDIFSYPFRFILAHISRPKNVQNNCINLSGFGLDITRLDFAPGKWETLLADKKFFNSEKLFGVFNNKPLKILRIFPVLLQTKYYW